MSIKSCVRHSDNPCVYCRVSSGAEKDYNGEREPGPQREEAQRSAQH